MTVTLYTRVGLYLHLKCNVTIFLIANSVKPRLGHTSSAHKGSTILARRKMEMIGPRDLNAQQMELALSQVVGCW